MDLINKQVFEDFFLALPPEKKRLGLWVLASVVLHVFFFYVIQVGYPVPAIARGKVTHLSLEGVPTAGATFSSGEQLWQQLQDPARLMVPQEPLLAAKEWAVELQPRLKSAEEGLVLQRGEGLALEFLPGGLAPLSERAKGELQPARQSFVYPGSKAEKGTSESVVQWSSNLAARLDVAKLSLPSVVADLPEETKVTVLTVGVMPNGLVGHVLVQESCGKSKIDTIAVEAVQGWRMKPTGRNGVEWGTMTVFWDFQGDNSRGGSEPKKS